MNARHTLAGLVAYGGLRMPLALLELPLFVLLPAFYHRTLGLDLALIGSVLFFGRFVDALADPVIGASIDRWRARFDERMWIRAAIPVVMLGFAAMFLPPDGIESYGVWLAFTSLVTYLGYSAVSIAYQSWGAGIGTTSGERARVTATREGFGLLGVVAASALLAPKHATTLVVAFVGLALLATFALRYAPAPLRGANSQPVGAHVAHAFAAWREVLGNRSFRWLLAAFMFNGIATAIPATLVLFFIRDVLGGGDTATAVFLIAYFLSGALGMPLWVHIAKRFGLRNAWLVGIAFAVLAFIWALTLGQNDMAPFFAVCVLTGLALGSDLSIPPALLATVISDSGHGGRREGSYFGVWNLATKLNLAIAAGVALPTLAWLGYSPGPGSDTLALSLGYAAVPCALKLIAGMLVLLAPMSDGSSSSPNPTQVLR